MFPFHGTMLFYNTLDSTTMAKDHAKDFFEEIYIAIISSFGAFSIVVFSMFVIILLVCIWQR